MNPLPQQCPQCESPMIVRGVLRLGQGAEWLCLKCLTAIPFSTVLARHAMLQGMPRQQIRRLTVMEARRILNDSFV
jgi:hypothetical protein